MSWNADQQLRCQTCCKLYDRVEAIQVNQSALPWDSHTDNSLQLLAQQLIIELKQAWSGSQLCSASANDDDNDDDDDDDNNDDVDGDGDEDDRNKGITGDDNGCEERENNKNNGTPHRNADNLGSAGISCPHPACKARPPYSQRNNLQRHYTNRRLLSEPAYMSYQKT